MPMSAYNKEMFEHFDTYYGKECHEYKDDCHMCALSGCVPLSKGCGDADGYERRPLAIKDFVKNAKKCVAFDNKCSIKTKNREN